jgi:UDP-GlcNAc:undecaprenyl-phosphate GlcNAc-1-phosphate transferase
MRLIFSMQRLAIWLLPFAIAFFSATGLTALLVRIAPKRGWVSRPRQDRWNVRVVAQFGGIPFLFAASVAGLCFFPSRQNLFLLLLTWGMALLGLTDDIAKLPPRAKLLGQALLAVLAVPAGVVLPLTLVFWINAALTVFCIVGITNALNLLDNMDGQAGGLAMVASALVAFSGPVDPLRGLALCLTAALAGFLIFNVNPARVFMGDVGALPLGFFLACACVRTAQAYGRYKSLIAPCLILLVPIFDTVLVSVTRRMNGRPISLGARDHTSHRLVWLGLSERHAAFLLWTIGAIAGSAAFLEPSWLGGWAIGVAALFLWSAALFWVYLAALKLPDTWLSPGVGRVALIPAHVQQVAAHLFLALIDSAGVVLALYFACLARLESPDGRIPGGFLLPAGLAVAINIAVLLVFAGPGQEWRITRWRGLYRILGCSILAALLLAGVSAGLPRNKAIEPTVVAIDAVFTFLLLALGRSSGHIFDSIFGRKSAIEAPVASPGSRPRSESAGSRLISPVDQLVSETASAKKTGLERRPS